MTIPTNSLAATGRVGLSIACACWVGGSPSATKAEEATAILTADNHYALYHGPADGQGLTFVGRNEFGPGGDPGGFNWTVPETWTFTCPAGHHLFVVAWNDFDDASYAMWIGRFYGRDAALVSNTQDWQVIVGSGANPGDDGEAPPVSVIESDLKAASWLRPADSGPFGSGIWSANMGSIRAFGASDFVWHDSLTSGRFNDHYLVFRSARPLFAAPPPDTQLEDPRALSGRSVWFRLVGEAGRWYEIQTSFDLEQWHPCQSVNNATGSLEVTQELTRLMRDGPVFFRAVKLDGG